MCDALRRHLERQTQFRRGVRAPSHSGGLTCRAAVSRSMPLPQNPGPPLHSPLQMTPQVSWRSSRLHTLPSPHAGARALAAASRSCWQDMFTVATRADLCAVSIGVRSGPMGVRRPCSKNAASGEWENERYSWTPNIRACLSYIV